MKKFISCIALIVINSKLWLHTSNPKNAKIAHFQLGQKLLREGGLTLFGLKSLFKGSLRDFSLKEC